MENTTVNVSSNIIDQFRKTFKMFETKIVGEVNIATIMAFFDITDVLPLYPQQCRAILEQSYGSYRIIYAEKGSLLIQHEKKKNQYYPVEDFLIKNGRATKTNIFRMQQILFNIV